MAESNIVELTVNSRLQEKYKSAIRIRNFHPFHMDEPEELGGSDSAPNPMEYVLSALCGCETVMLQMIAKELEMELADIQITAIGAIDIRGLQGVKGISPHFQWIKQEIQLRIPSGKEKIDQLLELMKQRCPAYNLVKDAQINIQLEYTVLSS